jgi:general secretion pathway protein G
MSINLKNGLKTHPAGFTLIELMITVAIVGILTSIAIPNYIKYKENARIVVAITDMKFLEKEIIDFSVKNLDLPENLSVIGRDNYLDPWGRPYKYLKIQGNDGKGGDFKPRKDLSLHPLNSDFDLYSVGKDGQSQAPLTSKSSQDDVIRANNGGFMGLGSNY